MQTPARSPAAAAAATSPSGAAHHAVVVSPNKRGVVAAPDGADPGAAPHLVCVCAMCSCGRHRCPPPPPRAVPFAGASTYSEAYIAPTACPVHAAAPPPIDHAVFASLPFTAQSTYAHDYPPHVLVAAAPSRQHAPQSPARVIKFDATSEAHAAYHAYDLKDPSTMRFVAPPAPAPLPSGPAPRFEAETTSRHDFVAWPLPKPAPHEAAAPPARSPLKFDATTEASDRFRAPPRPEQPQPRMLDAAAAAVAALPPRRDERDFMSESRASYNARAAPAPPAEPPCPAAGLPVVPSGAARESGHVLYDTDEGRFL